MTHIIRERFEFKVKLNLINSCGFSYSSEVSFGEEKKERNRTILLKGLDLCVPAWARCNGKQYCLSFSICIRHLFLWEAQGDCGKCSSLRLKEPALLC